MAEYEEILPGAAERILSMAEEQSKHRRSMEKIVIESGSIDSLLGVVTGFLIGISTISGGVFLAYNNKELSGLALGTSGLASLVGVFIYGTRSRRKEREANNWSTYWVGAFNRIKPLQ